MAEGNSEGLNEVVQCEITGEWLPEEDTVVFQGKRVSAQGKQILMDQLQAGELLPGEMEAPTRLTRLGCIILDGIIFLPIGVILGAVLAMLFISQGSMSSPVNAPRIEQSANLIVALVTLCYFALMHKAYGKTVGKMAGKIKVVKMDGSPISSGQAWLRALVYSGLGFIPAVIVLVLGDAGLQIAGVLSILVGVFGIANCLAVLFHPEQRAIHDMISGTRVIRAAP